MHVVGAGQPPQLLPGGVVPAQGGRAIQVAPACAMRVDRQLRVTAQLVQPHQPDRVQAGHHAGAARGQHDVVAAAHLVEVAGQVEGHHRLAAAAIGGAVHDGHHPLHPLLEGAVRAVGLELVVLDEVDAAVDQRRDLLGGLLGVQAHAGLDDGADQRAARHAGQPARARHAEGRPGVRGHEGRRQLQVEDPQARDRAQLEQVAGDRGHQHRQRRPEVLDGPGQLQQAAGVVRRAHRRGQAGLAHALEHLEPLDARARARLELGRFHRQRDEGAARLLAGDRVGGALRVVAGFQPVACADAFGHLVSGPRRGRAALLPTGPWFGSHVLV